MATELTVKEAAEARHSIRKYTKEPISDAEIQAILDVARLAPSPWNIQPWRVYAFKDQAKKVELQAAAYGQPQVAGAAVTFVITSDMEDAVGHMEETVHPGYGDKLQENADSQRGIFAAKSLEDRGQWGYAYSFIFVGFLLLAAQARGWSSSAMAGFEPDKVRKVLGLPDSTTVVALVAVGKADEAGFPHHRHSVDRFLTII